MANDSVIYAVEKHSSDEMTERLARTLECFTKELAEGPRILTVPLHPHLTGVPHRIGFLERFLIRSSSPGALDARLPDHLQPFRKLFRVQFAKLARRRCP